jgi:hypothetical protein
MERQDTDITIPHLPQEIWVQIIGSIVDFRYLPRVWRNYRRVSRAFKDATEHAFLTHYLPLIEIPLSTTWKYRENSDMQKVAQLWFTFASVSEDASCATFVATVRHSSVRHSALQPVSWFREAREGMWKVFTHGWKRDVAWYEGTDKPYPKPMCPPYDYVKLGCLVNDCDLPALKSDYEKREICFLWKEMLNSWFCEEEYIRLARATLNEANWHDFRPTTWCCAMLDISADTFERRLFLKVRELRILRRYKKSDDGFPIPREGMGSPDASRIAYKLWKRREAETRVQGTDEPFDGFSDELHLTIERLKEEFQLPVFPPDLGQPIYPYYRTPSGGLRIAQPVILPT